MDKMTDSRALDIARREMQSSDAFAHIAARLREPADAQAQGGGEAGQRVAAFVVEYQRRVSAQTRGGLHHDTIYTLGTSDATLELRVSDLAAILAAAPPSAPVGVEAVAAKIGVRYEQNESCKIGVPFYAFTTKELRRFAAALAQQPAADGGFTAADMMDARQEGRKEAQHHAAERLAEALRNLSADLRTLAGGETPDGDGVPVNVILWAEKRLAALRIAIDQARGKGEP